MGNFILPQNLNSAKETPPPPNFKKKEELAEEKLKKEISRFSLNEKLKLFFIIAAAIIIPVLGTFVFSQRMYQSNLNKYKEIADNQIVSLKNQINTLTNPSVKQLDQYEILIKSKKTFYNKEKEELEKNILYQDLIKKNKELDNQIIICNVHLYNIEVVKQNNYKEVETILEKLKKENFK